MKNIAYSLVLWIVGTWCSVQPVQAQLYKDPSRPAEERAADLLQRMTLEEKIAQIRHIHSWDIFDGQRLDTKRLRSFVGDRCWGFVEGFPLTGESCHDNMNRIQRYMVEHTRLGIPIFTVAEALHGSVHEGSSIFPQNIALASTFNPRLAYRRAEAIARELHYEGIRQILAPCIDVVRDLRWGRVEETFGEDPFLNSVFACEEVRGYLDNGISPMLKHFGAHGNPTGGLNLASVNCGVGELHDVYLLPFRKVITSLPVQAVMSTYNSWNRVPNSSSHYLLTDVLRDMWGFKGYVYSDWGAIDMLHTFHRTASSKAEAAFQALSAGLDVEASSDCYPKLAELVKKGNIDIRLIDEAVRRVLLAKFRAGLFEDPYGERYATSAQLHPADNRSLAREIAEESAVLLKNDNQLLPLSLPRLGSLAVIGPNADQVQFGDYSWSRSNTDGITPLSAIRRMAEEHGVEVRYARGCDLMSTDTTHIAEAVAATKTSDVAIVFCGSASASLARDYGGANCGEGFDLSDLSLTGAQGNLIRAVHATGKPVVLVLVTGKPFALQWEKANIPAILVQWYAGEEEGNAIANILFGRTNPSGHLTVSFPQSTGHLPAYYNHLPTDRGFYHKHGSPETPGRDYVFSSPNALWSFGHGMSYTTFAYDHLKIDQRTDSIKVYVDITNTGKVAGKAVPQLYVRDVYSSVATPVKQLKAFNKILLSPGERARVALHFAVADLAFTDESGKSKVEPGEFELQVGESSDSILLRHTINIGNVPTLKAEETVNITKTKINGKLINISGVVRDVQATPIEHVEIYSTGNAQVVAVTDKYGKYAAKVASDDVLVFKKSGFTNVSREVNGKKTINLKMQ